MILRKRDKKHAEAIIKHCTDSGMSVESTMELWNHLVRLFKRMELLEGRALTKKKNGNEKCPICNGSGIISPYGCDRKCHYCNGKGEIN